MIPDGITDSARLSSSAASGTVARPSDAAASHRDNRDRWLRVPGVPPAASLRRRIMVRAGPGECRHLTVVCGQNSHWLPGPGH